jgi:hypothetical protein
MRGDPFPDEVKKNQHAPAFYGSPGFLRAGQQRQLQPDGRKR